MILGYHTNGLAHHAPMAALQMLSDTGYKSVAIEINHQWLNPQCDSRFEQLKQIKQFLENNQMRNVVEASARFVLDAHRKYWPTLMESDSSLVQCRSDFIRYCIDSAVFLDSNCVTITSGIKPEGQSFQSSLDLLAKNLEPILRFAEERDVNIAFEPEPGMLIDTTGRFERLIHLVDSPKLKMTLDIGHLFCLSEVPIVEFIERWKHRIVNVHIEDMKAGIHEHLMFGEGQIHFPPVIEALLENEYKGPLHVDLDRHSHDGAATVHESYQFLNAILDDARSALE